MKGQAAGTYEPALVPIAGEIVTIFLTLATLSVLVFCLTRRVQSIRSWKKLPINGWLVFLIYLDSYTFVVFTALVAKGLGINTSPQICEGAIILCLICYVTTKVMVYYFLVEKAVSYNRTQTNGHSLTMTKYIIRGSRKPRLKDRLWKINFFGMMCPYLIIIVLNFVFRIAYIDDGGQCIIGMKKAAMIPLITFDVIVNVYLTILFLIPLRRLYSYKHDTNHSLRIMALRTFIGSCATLISSVANLTVLMLLNGEPGWICLMLCNADVLFTAIVLHWITSIDSTRNTSGYSKNRSVGDGDATTPAAVSQNLRSQRLSIHGENGQIWHDENGLTKLRSQGPCVTTKIVGGVDDSQDNIALQGIQVRTEQRREVEVDGRSESSARSGERTIGVAVSGRGDSTENIV
ncbi:hypothetical protein P152DRAFT_214120 [Eremomyces bilateralis CBS 781.70]|uniref:Integral membrane protein n=1 Tax=Eremomyces bilateralis CBS 781.70 TaxID=1392243 RepID=A0A6G1FS86_9PEZI|nr:uncharacterized protein P152DRAFT_214120 [Eremomyces bilateralis CBS 781.70]KAF1808596.1 hypothetical protein P152DRAFT_214120 [Eremomyces bilateralis CBS 781.70]